MKLRLNALLKQRLLHIFVHLDLLEFEQVVLSLEACDLLLKLKCVVVESYDFVTMHALSFFVYLSDGTDLRRHSLVSIGNHAERGILVLKNDKLAACTGHHCV